jgi:hypothetical protein
MQKALSEIRFCKVGHLALHRSNPLLRRQCLDVSGSVQHAMNRTTERMASKSLTAWVGSLQLVFCRLEVRKESCLVVTAAVQNSLQHCTMGRPVAEPPFCSSAARELAIQGHASLAPGGGNRLRSQTIS